MGAKQTKIENVGDNHPARFYDGCAKVQEGCYTVAEIYFNQAIRNHPGHAFWTDVMEVTVPKGDRGSDAEDPFDHGGERRDVDGAFVAAPRNSTSSPPLGLSLHDGNESSRRTDGVSADSPRQAAQTIPSLADDEDADSVAAEAAARVPALIFPVDRRLVDLQDYVRMLSDIARIYRRKVDASGGDSCDMALKLSMMYNSYTAVRLQAMLHLLQTHFAEHNATGDVQGEDMFGLYGRIAAQPQSSFCRSKANSSINRSAMNGSLSNYTTGSVGQDDALCVFWESVQFLWMSNVLSCLTSTLRMVRSSGRNVPLDTLRTMFDLAYQCLEAVRAQLAPVAEANSHIYLGNLMGGFIAFLGNSIKECAAADAGPAASAAQNAAVHPKSRAPREGKAAYLRLGSSPSFADDQANFFRQAEYFTALSVPLLDLSRFVSAEMGIQCDRRGRRSIKLMTPMERSFPWYLGVDASRHFEPGTAFPGCSAYLLKMCGVPDDATMRDWHLFTAAGLEEMSIGLFRMAVITGALLHARGKTKEWQELRTTSVQFALNMYGCRTSISDLLDAQFQQMTDEASV
ncbi:putative sodium stibogluconate resistance protein [Leptomonas pyrrhocoris]|uniref:Putative sodium stibogluconate resistance protein n=1 Tax=Leptomonas pyrrhocoris TaxID=157538 RepID=A0A0M9FYW7_LEPPY|nr:putative sodium stibogluconate resistance protein [Leptomonas pyrrhocoris]KPA78970.1 putative sodium stibogluconate resistance protein [Leptomonas pyrrhocoris]|eukprot:XP_015657409.1 putative sodium stibogluconate resistance protein [Leptomonas pyrrhocoris]